MVVVTWCVSVYTYIQQGKYKSCLFLLQADIRRGDFEFIRRIPGRTVDAFEVLSGEENLRLADIAV